MAPEPPPRPPLPLAGKAALVTGGSRGIGQAIAIAFAQAGADVAFCARTLAALAGTTQAIQAAGRRALPLAAEVTDPKAVEGMVAEVLDKLGRLDILVNNAGITRDALLIRMKDAEWDEVLAVNLTGTFLCTRAVARVMMRQRSGRIINIASVVGLTGNAGQTNYAASKAGIIGLTKSVARELAGRGVTANAIAPGFIQTEMTQALTEEVKTRLLAEIPLGALGQPLDVAHAAVFLASDAARYITGQVLPVDGGLSI